MLSAQFFALTTRQSERLQKRRVRAMSVLTLRVELAGKFAE